MIMAICDVPVLGLLVSTVVSTSDVGVDVMSANINQMNNKNFLSKYAIVTCENRFNQIDKHQSSNKYALQGITK